MAQFEIHITEKGREMLAASVGGQAVQFTRMALGDGGYSGDLSLVEELISQKLELEIGRVEHRGSDASIQGTITADTEFAPFYWREIGLYAKMPGGPEMLAVYGNAGEKADYLDGTSGALDERSFGLPFGRSRIRWWRMSPGSFMQRGKNCSSTGTIRRPI